MRRTRGARAARRAATTPRAACGEIGASSSEEIELRDVPEGGDAILPVDLLALGVGAAGVADLDLEDARVDLREARGDLGLEAEPIRRQPRQHLAARDVPPHGLVAGL